MDFVFPEPEPEQEFQEYTASMDDMSTNERFIDEISETVIALLRMPAKEMIRIYLSGMAGESQDEHDYEIIKDLLFLGLVKLMEEVAIDRALADGRMEYIDDEDDNDEEEDDVQDQSP